jgi:hypothetical protein
MNWLVFSYSLPSKGQSSPRVTLWRRLRRLGAISVKTGVYILPDQEECIEGFQWLAQEVQQAKGEALVIHVEQFEGLSDSQVIELFRAARQEDYAELEAQAEEIEKTLNLNSELGNQPLPEALAKLRKRYNEILRIDFFDCPHGIQVATRLTRLEQALSGSLQPTDITTVTTTEFQDRRWVTRPRPFVDRIACAWFIRRFINPDAVIRYASNPAPDEVAFDMKEAEFGHQGNLCSLEVMIARFGLDKPGVRAIAEIVHELDLRDGIYNRPEAAGVEAILRGWLLAGLLDTELESRGIALFEGLYTLLSREELKQKNM